MRSVVWKALLPRRLCPRVHTLARPAPAPCVYPQSFRSLATVVDTRTQEIEECFKNFMLETAAKHAEFEKSIDEIKNLIAGLDAHNTKLLNQSQNSVSISPSLPSSDSDDDYQGASDQLSVTESEDDYEDIKYVKYHPQGASDQLSVLGSGDDYEDIKYLKYHPGDTDGALRTFETASLYNLFKEYLLKCCSHRVRPENEMHMFTEKFRMCDLHTAVLQQLIEEHRANTALYGRRGLPQEFKDYLLRKIEENQEQLRNDYRAPLSDDLMKYIEERDRKLIMDEIGEVRILKKKRKTASMLI